MKRFLCIFLTLILALSLFASVLSAAETEAPEGFKFDKKITIVCPWGEGGGADRKERRRHREHDRAPGHRRYARL